jgi:hypothetical protein
MNERQSGLAELFPGGISSAAVAEVNAEAHQRGQRQHPVRGIDDNPTSGEWQTMGLGRCSGNVGFHIHSNAVRGVAQRPLVRWRDYRSIDASNIGVNGTTEVPRQSPGPIAIGWIALVDRHHSASYHPIAGSELGSKAARDAKTDHAAAAVFDRCLQGGAQIRGMAVKDRDPRAGCNPRFERKARHGNRRPRLWDERQARAAREATIRPGRQPDSRRADMIGSHRRRK